MAINRLSFDVLGHIFSYYPSNETIHHPTETLLLVCHAWHDAAVGHRSLWGDFNIYIGHSPTSAIWKKRLPLRLARAGPVTPLYISLFNVLDMNGMEEIAKSFRKDHPYSDRYCTNPYPAGWPLCEDLCPCYKDARECAEFALECLTDTDGNFCARWKKFHVDLGYAPAYDASRRLAMAFCHPTPSLTSLHISNLMLDDKDKDLVPFIEIPRLRELVVKDCYFFKALDLRALHHIHIDAGHNVGLGDFSDLQSACQLKSICVRYFQPQLEAVLLPERLPSLTSLEIEGPAFSPDLATCEMPNLSTMTLKFEDENLVYDILNCQGINLEKLENLTLIWAAYGLDAWPAHQYEHLLGSLAGLLNRAPNLSYVAGNWNIHNLLFKVLWDSWSEDGPDGILGSKQFMLHLIVDVRSRDITSEEAVKISASNDIKTLEKLASDWDLFSPDLPIDEFLRLFTKNEDEGEDEDDEDEDEDDGDDEDEDEDENEDEDGDEDEDEDDETHHPISCAFVPLVTLRR